MGLQGPLSEVDIIREKVKTLSGSREKGKIQGSKRQKNEGSKKKNLKGAGRKWQNKEGEGRQDPPLQSLLTLSIPILYGKNIPLSLTFFLLLINKGVGQKTFSAQNF